MYARGVRCSDCHDPHALDAPRRGQRGLHPVPLAGGQRPVPDAAQGALRRSGAYLPPGGVGGGGMQELPHAAADLHGGGPAARPRLPGAAAGPLGGDRGAERLHRLPHRPRRRPGRRRRSHGASRRARTGARASRRPSRRRAGIRRRRRRRWSRWRGQAGIAGIVRATALDLLTPVADPAIADRAAPLLADPDPLVRGAAAGVQRALPPEARLARLAPVLGDPLRAVRVAAAKAMLGAEPTGDRAERRGGAARGDRASGRRARRCGRTFPRPTCRSAARRCGARNLRARGGGVPRGGGARPAAGRRLGR